MTIERSSTHQERGGTESDLDRLIDLESRLQGFLAKARARAAERLEAARIDAAAIEDRLDTRLATRERELEARIEREVASRTAALEAQSQRRAKRYDAISEETVQALASKVLERLARGEPS